MKLKLKEDPREWRKSVWLTLGGLAFISSLLRWRKVLPIQTWYALLILFALCAVAAAVRPSWFRSYYRLSMRAGFVLSEVVARVVLTVVFLVLITPLGVLSRILGKDALKLKRRSSAESYWSEMKSSGDLERMF